VGVGVGGSVSIIGCREKEKFEVEIGKKFSGVLKILTGNILWGKSEEKW